MLHNSQVCGNISSHQVNPPCCNHPFVFHETKSGFAFSLNLCSFGCNKQSVGIFIRLKNTKMKGHEKSRRKIVCETFSFLKICLGQNLACQQMAILPRLWSRSRGFGRTLSRLFTLTGSSLTASYAPESAPTVDSCLSWRACGLINCVATTPDSLCRPAARITQATEFVRFCEDFFYFFFACLPLRPPLCQHQHLCVFACGRIGKEGKMKKTPAAHPRPKLFSERKPHHRVSKMGDFFVKPPLHTSQGSSLGVHQQGKWKNAVAVALLRILQIAFSRPRRSRWLEEIGKREINEPQCWKVECSREKSRTTVRPYFMPRRSLKASHRALTE